MCNFSTFLGAASIQVRLLFKNGLYAMFWVCETWKIGLAHVKMKKKLLAGGKTQTTTCARHWLKLRNILDENNKHLLTDGRKTRNKHFRSYTMFFSRHQYCLSTRNPYNQAAPKNSVSGHPADPFSWENRSFFPNIPHLIQSAVLFLAVAVLGKCSRTTDSYMYAYVHYPLASYQRHLYTIEV